MLKPQRLQKGDKVAIVSTSAGTLGEKWAIHKLDIARERLEALGLEVVVMKNALKGRNYLYEHPEARAEDFMEAFRDSSIKAIFNAIGGDDSIRLLPYIDFDVIKNNPKIFTGFSDTTSMHFMMQKAGVISYYGLAVLTDLSEYVKMNDYTYRAMMDTLFEPKASMEIVHSDICSYEKDKVWWKEENKNTLRKVYPDTHGYEVLQGTGKVEGVTFGGCIDVFPELMCTKLWLSKEEWKGKILFLETSEENMSEEHLTYYLRGMMAQGVFDEINGILVGKPAFEEKYEGYREVYKKVIGFEAKRPDLPILYNVNIGHAYPITILPIGERVQIDCERKTLTLMEQATK